MGTDLPLLISSARYFRARVKYLTVLIPPENATGQDNYHLIIVDFI